MKCIRCQNSCYRSISCGCAASVSVQVAFQYGIAYSCLFKTACARPRGNKVLTCAGRWRKGILSKGLYWDHTGGHSHVPQILRIALDVLGHFEVRIDLRLCTAGGDEARQSNHYHTPVQMQFETSECPG